jgi:hypothetical protein
METDKIANIMAQEPLPRFEAAMGWLIGLFDF